DVIDGGQGNDSAVGGVGTDTFFGGAGSDTFTWNQGDGSDLIEGGSGDADAVIFNGNPAAADTITLSALGNRLQLDRTEGAVNLNMADIENLSVNELGGGVGTITVNDLSETDLVGLDLDLGAADGAADAVSVSATNVADNVTVTEAGGVVSIAGLAYSIEVTNANAGDVDTLELNLGAGDDVSFVAANVMQEFITTTNGGAGNDSISGYQILNGDAGDDVITGGNGAETLNGGAGNDILIAGPGDDTVNGGDGDDTYVVSVSSQGGADVFTGGAGFDTVSVLGGDGPDNISVDEAAGVHTIDINAGGPTSLSVASDFERILVESGEGNDVVTTSGAVVGLEVQLGAGDDVLDAEAQTTPVIAFGGQGNDNLTGSDPADGAAVSDQLFGGDGDDIIEGGRGRDQFFGGAGNDYFIWVAGDGSDLMEGGTGDADQLVFIANDGDQVLQVYGGGLFNDNLGGFFPGQTLNNSTRAIFELNVAQVFLNTGDVESIEINALGGVDNIVINNQVDTLSGGDSPAAPANPISTGTDLAATALQSVEVSPGDGDDYVEVHGTAGDDNIDVAVQGGAVTVAGASVLVEVAGAVATDRLHVHGQTGNDDLKAADGVENTIGITLEGDAGDDVLSADAILIGGADDDLLRGGAGDDLLFGGAGEDTLIGGGGLDTIDGGDDFDQILIEGTSADDAILVSQLAAGTLDFSVNGVADTDTITTVAGVPTVESVRVEAGDGADTIVATWVDALGVD
ncbi:MAG: hypothetical protein MI861_05805, partial [Pirellulales bacterium]|nr:hypothetical protein [Pirellulales bacterium]